MKFSNICTAKQATVLRSNVYTQVDTICVYKDMFMKDHKLFKATILCVFGFLVPSKFLGCTVFLRVFHTNLQSAYKLLYPYFTGSWETTYLLNLTHSDRYVALIITVPESFCRARLLNSKRCWAQNMNMFSKKKFESLKIWLLLTVLCYKNIISVFNDTLLKNVT